MAGKASTIRRTAAIVSLSLITAATGFTLGAAPASAAPANRYVATTGDDGAGQSINDCTDQALPCKTVQHAVDESSAGDTVHVGAGEYPESITIGIPLTIVGAGRDATNISGNHDNSPSISIQPVESTIAVTLESLSASHNEVAPGVVAFGADLTISDALLSDNLDAGVIAVFSTLHVSGSVVADTLASPINVEAAAPLPFGGGSGIVIAVTAADVDRSTISGNAASGVQVIAGDILAPGARELAADAPPPTTVGVTHSTVSGNQVGGIVDFGGASVVDTSTIAQNVGGGVVTLAPGATAMISNSTITGTTPFPGESGGEQGGVIDLTSVNNGLALSSAQRGAMRASVTKWAADHPVTVKRASRKVAAAAPEPTTGTTVLGSIVAAQAGLPDCFGPVVDGGYNLSSDTANSCKFSTGKHDLVKTQPKLGALAGNGGPTKTEKPLKGSPAIDAIAGGRANCVADATDQRGIERPQPVGNACDIGAVELAAKAIVIHPDSLPNGTVGEKYHARITATGGAYPTYAFSLAPGSSLPDGLTMDVHGHIAGTPTKAGTFKFTVSVNDPVLKRYTIVIEDAATNGNGEEPISATGTPVWSLSAVGAGTVFAGFLLMVGAGLVGKRPGRHRVRS